MELVVLLLTFALFWKASTSLRCYQCDPEDPYKTSNLCENFDYSDKFLVECHSSTMCFKKQTYLRVDNGMNSTGIQRGCASQTLNGEQRKINGKWQYVSTIYDAYNATCFEDPSDSERVTKTIYCYCEGDKCNGAIRLTLNSFLVLILIIISLNFTS